MRATTRRLHARSTLRSSAWASSACRDSLVRTLSQGQRRRAALARLAVPSRSVVWLLDEPYDALDQASTAMLDAVLREHTARGGCIVLTSHQPLGEGAPAHTEAWLRARAAHQQVDRGSGMTTLHDHASPHAALSMPRVDRKPPRRPATCAPRGPWCAVTCAWPRAAGPRSACRSCSSSRRRRCFRSAWVPTSRCCARSRRA